MTTVHATGTDTAFATAITCITGVLPGTVAAAVTSAVAPAAAALPWQLLVLLLRNSSPAPAGPAKRRRPGPEGVRTSF